MTPAALEALLRIALPPLRLALRERYLVVRRQDDGGGRRGRGTRNRQANRGQLARDGHWN